MIFSLGGLSHAQDPYVSRLLLTVLPSTRYAYVAKKVSTGRMGKRKRFKMRQMKCNATFRAISEFLGWSLDHLRKGCWPDKPYVPFPNKSERFEWRENIEIDMLLLKFELMQEKVLGGLVFTWSFIQIWTDSGHFGEDWFLHEVSLGVRCKKGEFFIHFLWREEQGMSSRFLCDSHWDQGRLEMGERVFRANSKLGEPKDLPFWWSTSWWWWLWDPLCGHMPNTLWKQFYTLTLLRENKIRSSP